MCQDWVLNKKQFRNNSFIFKSSMLYSFKSLCLHIMLTSEFLLKIATFFKISSKSSVNHIIFAFELTIPILWFDDIYNRQKLFDESIFNHCILPNLSWENRSSRPKVLHKKAVPKNFAKLHLWRNCLFS